MVRVEKNDGVFLVSIARPEARNAVDRPTADALSAALRQFENADDAYVAVLAGDGGHFCAGADLKAFATDRRNRLEWPGDGPMGPSRMQFTKPVIAAIEGYAVAGGLELACLCDMRVAARNATLGVFCRRFGVPLIDGGTVRLPQIIGLGRAMDLILTGRPIQAEEALSMGLINRICEPGAAVETAIELARSIASFPPRCMNADRASVYRALDLPLEQALEQEFHHGIKVLEESAAGARAFSEGRGRGGSFDE